MKLLKISAAGLPLFKEELVLTFYAQQRVSDDDRDSLYPIDENSRFYLNFVNAIVGINASGKTSVLKVIQLALDILNNKPINHSSSKEILGDCKDAAFTINFLSDNHKICQLETHISVAQEGIEKIYRIEKEKLWVKDMKSSLTKKKLVDFSGVEPYSVRSNDEEYLSDDTSIMIAFNKKNGIHLSVTSLLLFTDLNILLPFSTDIKDKIISFFDPTVEKLIFEDNAPKSTIHLKFKGKEEILLSNPVELNRYLSSGTIKGITTFTLAIQTMKEGGYLIIDELENHFNKEITATLIRLFMDPKVNKNGGVLIFSTHYPELLDEFDRNDCIFVTRNRNGITAASLNDLLKRNDIKKSDAFQSGMLDGTVPSYDSYIKLKKEMQSSINKEANNV